MKKVIFLSMLMSTFSCKQNLTPEQESRIDQQVEDAMQQDLDNFEMKKFSWSYETSENEMTGEKTTYAVITSADVVKFDFPYEGESYLTLGIRKAGKTSEAYFQITKGQITEDFSKQAVTVRFDEEKAEDFGVNEAADHDQTFRFINNADKFIEKLKKSKNIKLQVSFYHGGTHVFNFNSAGLKF